jgi:hypothetical protein
LELLGESGTLTPDRLAALHKEADELTAILVTCVQSAKGEGGMTNKAGTFILHPSAFIL